MKKILLVLLLCLTVLPLSVKAVDISTYETMNLEQALTEEGIEHNLSNYKENDKQIPIYVFRGKGCPHCQEFLEFLNSIVDEYGKYFRVVSFESWYNLDNNNLMAEVSTFMGQTATGVPYIVIGDKAFRGYSSGYDDAIKKAITDLYNSKDRYDVFEEMSKVEEPLKINYFVIIFSTIVVVVFMGGIVLVYMTKQNVILASKIDALSEKLEKINSKEEKTKEVKQASKTSSKKKN